MAFALTKFNSYGIDVAGPSFKRGMQHATFTITALVTDVALDLSAAGGTFWTAAIANATYGTLATNALVVLGQIQNIAAQLWSIKSEQLLDRLQEASATGTDYTVAITTHTPDITCAASNGETAWVIDLEWQLTDGSFPIVASYG